MRRLILLSALLGTLLNLLACGSDPDLMAIRSGIRSISVATENHDAAGITAFIASNYTGVGGSRAGVNDLLQQHFSINKNINIIISDIDIMIADDKQTAMVNVRVLMTGGDGNLPERGRLSAIRSTWNKQEGQWKITRADWKPVLLNF